ncbi:MAG: TetR/AcrR family transcriptional regulator [Deltaproteobacteria bacterium]|nr:TetR/AcrR family transcriptional regulator [Deltaproteobacteria bacterium]MBI3386214.1 TetR/AcrR family transcriptional regulator [Deltaproteobacteria bacterium]
MAQVVRLGARRRRDPEGTYEEIVAAARAMMAERGPEALTVSDVAHRAGVNRTTAYQHFRTRDDLVGAVMARLADETSRMLTADIAPGDRIDHMVEYFLQHPEIARLWMFQMLANIQLPNRVGWTRYMKAMQTLASSDRTQPGIDPEMLGHILLAAILVWSLRGRSGTKDEGGSAAATRRFTRELKRLLLYGVMCPERWPEMAAAVKKPTAGRRQITLRARRLGVNIGRSKP